jgi:hypothetical protein
MNRQERLEQLQKLRIERQEEYDEPVFESHSACLVQCILESGYALAMIAGWHPNV